MTQHSFAAALLDPNAPCPPGLQAWNGSDPTRRYDVYRNNVASSLVGALADTFPVVRALVGDEFFCAMALVFLRRSPPSSPLLVRFGETFPEFIETFEPARPLPYLADVARLEMARLQSLHAPDAPPLDALAAERALRAGGRSGELQLALHPSLRLVESTHPVVSIWAAHQGQGELETVDLGVSESALVVRPQWEVLVAPCDRGTVEWVRSLPRAGDLAAGAAAAASHVDLVAALGLLLRHGAIVALTPLERPSA